MTSKEKQLTELLVLTSRSLTHMTAAMTSLSFDLLGSTDPRVRSAGSRMVVRLEAVSHELDKHWQLIGDLTGEQPSTQSNAVEKVELFAAS
jgi:hypothetical protein